MLISRLHIHYFGRLIIKTTLLFNGISQDCHITTKIQINFQNLSS